MGSYLLSAIKREGRVQDIRAASRIPAIMYGKGIAPQELSVPRSEFVKVAKAAGSSSLIDLSIDGQAPVKILVKEIQRHVLRMDPIHVDLYQVNMNTEITAKVPLVFVGESAAVKTAGGTLMKSMDEIEVECLPGNLPHEIEIDLSKLTDFEAAITIGSLTLPTGVKATADAELTIASVSRPLTEDELKKLEEGTTVDVTAIKTEGEEKKAAEEAKKAEEEAAAAK